MQIRKWLALLVSAALALSLLAGCGGKNQSLAQVILDLLDGQYANVAVEIDPDLEADLRQAVHEGETDAEIRAALEKILGSGVSFRLIGDGQQGDTAWNLILYPGSDPDAAARSAFTEWSKVFGSLPRDGQYSAGLAMLETENGYAILVKATVDKAASRDDDDDEPEDEKVKGNGFTYNVTKNTITVEPDSQDGLKNLLTKQDDEDEKITDARADGFAGVTIELAAGSYSVDSTFTTTFKGTLKGESPTNKATVTLNEGSRGLFKQIGEYDGSPENNGTVENITFDVQTNITNTYADSVGNSVGNSYAGAVAGQNNGNITNCEVELNGYTINASGSLGFADAGGLVGYNGGTITDCTVTINGSISATSDSIANAGGIAGDNQRHIKNSQVTLNSDSQVTLNSGGSIQATGTDMYGQARAGGLAGQNAGTVDGDTYSGDGDISATATANASYAGGLVGFNSWGTVTVSATYTGTGTIKAKVGSDEPVNPSIPGQTGPAYAGTKIGNNNGRGPVNF